MNHLIFLSVPGLRPGDISRETTPTLHAWADSGVLSALIPTFPCVTSCVQASMWTGAGPGEHGVIANGFYDRGRRTVEFWVARNGVIAGEQIWDAIKRRNPNHTSAVWHAQNIKDASADFIVTPAPIHEDDGTMKLWCYSKPDGLYQQLLDHMGHFPLQHYWGPLSNIESTRWILRAAFWLIEQHAPNFHWIYIPHLDYASQKHGPNSPEAKEALVQLDQELAEFSANIQTGRLGGDVTYLVAGEYAMTEVSGVVYPNRILREAGVLCMREEDGAEHIDFENSTAFAMVDHQLAHVYVNDPSAVDRVRDLFACIPGVAGAFAGDQRCDVGLNNERSGEVILTAEPSQWFAYYWWLDDAKAPAFARTVDIHAKPGYDPVELFFDPTTKSIPLDASLVRGSHGAPAVCTNQRGAILCSRDNGVFGTADFLLDTDIERLVLDIIEAD